MQHVRMAPNPVTVSVVWVNAQTCDVGLRQNSPVRLSGPHVRLAVGLLLAEWQVPLCATCWTRTGRGAEHAGQSDEFLTPALAYAQTNGAKKAQTLLKEHRI
ncbi:hypothetical protein [Shimia sagamensis]|nr:hypothetical protein [Shimia sagamensis]